MGEGEDSLHQREGIAVGGKLVQENRITLSAKHPFHLVDPSPWPFVGSLSALVLATGGVLAMHGLDKGVFPVGIAMLLLTMLGWHAAVAPTEATGHVWPPKNIIPLDPFHLPYFNTLVLLLSGTTVTWAHHALLENNRKEMLQGLGFTIALGILFTTVQAIEYAHASFSFKDGIYPSTFFMATGFHGFHVIVGTIFLMVCWVRAYRREFTPAHHVGFEAAAWYWHFVDVVWLFLFVSIYWWGYR
ncbi:MAG: cytochrome [Alphaproteobacteria bacterium]|nr:cytochrome [Alphaproteobacteria bacterium]